MVSTRIYCLGCPFMEPNVDFWRKSWKCEKPIRLLSEWGGFPWTGYLIPVRVCLPVAVGHGTCWLVVVVAAVGVISRFFRLTFRPRFAKSRNCLRTQTLENDLQFYSTPFCREFRCASSWHSHLTRLSTFWKKDQASLKSTKIDKIHKIHASKSRGVFFLRSPKRRRQRPPDAQGWGSQSGVKTVPKEDFE